MDQICNNNGLLHILEEIFINLDFETYLKCRLVNSHFKSALDNPKQCWKKVFRGGNWCLKNFKEKLAAYEIALSNCQPNELLQFIPSWHLITSNGLTWYEMQYFEISMEDFKNAWMNLLFENEEKKSCCPNSKDPVLHLMNIFRAIDDLKAAFKDCHLENHPYKVMALINKDSQMYKNGNALVMTRPIIEFLDLELKFRLTYLDYRPRSHNSPNECVEFINLVENGNSLPKLITKIGDEIHEYHFGLESFIFCYENNYKTIHLQPAEFRLGLYLDIPNFWAFQRLQDDPQMMKNYTKEVSSDPYRRRGPIMGTPRRKDRSVRNKLWLMWNLKACLDHRINKDLKYWSKLFIGGDFLDSRHDYAVRGSNNFNFELWRLSMKCYSISKDFKEIVQKFKLNFRHPFYGPFNTNPTLLVFNNSELPNYGNQFHEKSECMATFDYYQRSGYLLGIEFKDYQGPEWWKIENFGIHAFY